MFLVLIGCIQGPWDYYPKNPANYKGLWVTGYVIADQPLSDICIEKLIELEEEYTDAFAYFTSATVEVSGKFSDGSNLLVLQPHPEKVSCFVGDPNVLPLIAENYQLSATVVWDSSGTRVTTNISGEAKIPTQFSIKDTATAPVLAETGLSLQLDTSENVLEALIQSFGSLPPEAIEQIQQRYGDTLLTFINDTAGAIAFYNQEQNNLTAILNEYTVTYTDGDSMFYLGGAFNTQSHKFTANFSRDVAGVLITHRFDSTSGKPITSFDELFGDPKPEQFYFPGDIRRLIYYPAFRTGDNRNLLDSMGVVNSWFFTGWNKLYFYGMDLSYTNYIESSVNEQNNSTVVPQYNVQGAAGIFVGGIKDSFEVFIRVDSSTQQFYLFEARAADCSNKSWDVHKGCREFYPLFCAEMNWNSGDCIEDLFHRALEGDTLIYLDADSAKRYPVLKQESGFIAKSVLTDSLNVDLSRTLSAPFPDSTAITSMLNFVYKDGSGDYKPKLKGAEIQYCIQNNFPVNGILDCSGINDECNGENRNYDCKEKLWQYCLDNKWKPEQCGLGMVSYCLDKPRLSELLCGHADDFCESNSSEQLCQEASQ